VTDEQFDAHIERLKFWGALAALGFLAFLAAMALGDRPLTTLLLAVAFLLMAPFLFYCVILIIWHWKGRYRGTHSDLWGALLVIETSGITKLVYVFRHLIPDARRTGRYKRPSNERPA
jgi:hypothetical protein